MHCILSPHALKLQDDKGRISVLNQNKVLAISAVSTTYCKHKKRKKVLSWTEGDQTCGFCCQSKN